MRLAEPAFCRRVTFSADVGHTSDTKECENQKEQTETAVLSPVYFLDLWEG